ncbi:MAG: hypothetical protein DRQ46_07900 [Gammaproteobacteria bacterium]|nr:MAG: hypothetical protein DRQ46_07900 [Gammaproteobacteria bacterium]
MSDLFEQVNKIWQGSSDINTKTKPDSTYMANRFISLDPNGLLVAGELNRMVGIHPCMALPFLKFSTKNRKAPRNKYPKKLVKGKKLSDKKKVVLKRICAKFNVAEFHGLQIMGLLEQQGFKLEANVAK